VYGLYREHRTATIMPLSCDIARHLYTRMLCGKATVITDKPLAMLASVRKQWVKLERQLRRERSSTLQETRLLELTYEIARMQSMRFTAKPPDSEPDAMNISLLHRQKEPPADLLTSRLYTEKTFYPAFLRDLNHATSEVILESPYITTRRVDALLPTLRKLRKRGVRITINTRNPGDHDEFLRIQAWTALKSLRPLGIQVRFFSNYHHRKIAVLDSRILWEGSLNILSQSHSREIMRRIESEELAKEMIQFLRLR
jgi:phosphatidylserine/phosphatidylglycerophosphate/cardiolipin synthase-like enzyme